VTATVARQRRLLTPRRRLLLAIIAAAALAAVAVHVRREPVPRCTTPELCVAALDGGTTLVSTRGAGPPDVSLQPAVDGSISLVGLDGTRHWRTSTKSTTPPRLVAAGDVGADGVTDYVVSLTRPLAASRACGAASAAETSLLVIDGRTGRTSAPFEALPDTCWNTPTFTYPTQQWEPGTVYIGEFTRAYRGPEVVVMPYYAGRGSVWNLAQSGRWQLVRTPSAKDFPYPSTAEFDRVYNATNPTPCSPPTPGEPCYVQNSHVANAVFPGGAQPGGLFVLTSSRALVYRPDLTPTSDVRWWPGGDTGNGGRNYGLVETYRSGGRTYVDLVGGCSTLSRWRAMAPGADPTGGDANCGIVRHFERFEVEGSGIARHQSVFYGYLGSAGALEGRVEYPSHAHAALGGPGSSWTAFNLLRSGTWSAQVFPDPATSQAIQLPGWYVWDTIRLPGGGAALLASPVAAGSVTPAWELDVLRWNGSSFVPIQHAGGVVPVLLSYASTPTRHTSEASLFGAYERPSAGGDRELLVVDPAGRRTFVSFAEADATAG
jgi:hypothetical protein